MISRTVRHLLLLNVCAGFVAAGCGHSASPTAPPDQLAATPDQLAATPAQAAADYKPTRIESEHLPNAYRVHDKVISGGLPEGDAAFAELWQLGVKTVISVDGARPDLERAARFGLRYVHLPHGYDGVPEERGRELAKAVRDLAGPIYIHCHHGKHRSPVAATVACVGAGLIEPGSALAVLRTAGTDENYRGLYQSAERASRFDDALLDELRAEFPETAPLPPMAESMVAIEQIFDRLKEIEANGWKSPADHSDLAPPHEALLLREQFTELLRAPETLSQPARFQELIRDSEAAGHALEAALQSWSGVGEVPTVLKDSFARVSKNCQTCHTEFRDVPLGEKQSP